MNKKAKQQKEYIVLNGFKFTIEWYFDSKGQSAALDYFDAMNQDAQIKSLGLFELMGNIGEIRNKIKFNYEGDKIYA